MGFQKKCITLQSNTMPQHHSCMYGMKHICGLNCKDRKVTQV